jgi:hypothetical protein
VRILPFSCFVVVCLSSTQLDAATATAKGKMKERIAKARERGESMDED